MSEPRGALLRKAANQMRAQLCYGGSGHAFFASIAAWWEREAFQAERVVDQAYGTAIYGEPDPAAYEAARLYLGSEE